MKLKRKPIAAKYASQIEAMYASSSRRVTGPADATDRLGCIPARVRLRPRRSTGKRPAAWRSCRSAPPTCGPRSRTCGAGTSSRSRPASDELDLDSVIETAERVHSEAGALAPPARLRRRGGGRRGRRAPPARRAGGPGGSCVMPHRGPGAAPAPPPGGQGGRSRRALQAPEAEAPRPGPANAPSGGRRASCSRASTSLGEVAAERSFAYEADGELVASCRLYSDGATAQIEDVGTAARRIAERATATPWCSWRSQEAWAAHDFVFIEAEAADWPKDWYARAGFEAAGAVCDLVRDQ